MILRRAGAINQQIDLGTGPRLQVGKPPVGISVPRQMRDLGDHEMLERLAVFVRPGIERDIESSVKRSLDAGVEEIEFRRVVCSNRRNMSEYNLKYGA